MDHKKLDREALQPGCYFDGCRGIYIGRHVQELALDLGWAGEPILDPEHAHYSDAEDEATEFLSSFAPENCWVGYSEHSGDWGVWACEEEED